MNDTLVQKWNQIRNDSQKLGQLTVKDFDRAKGNVEDFVELAQKKYGYTRAQAEHEVDRFLDNYDRGVYAVAHRLPGHMDTKVMHHPWAAIATALGLGLVVGFLAKPSH